MLSDIAPLSLWIDQLDYTYREILPVVMVLYLLYLDFESVDELLSKMHLLN